MKKEIKEEVKLKTVKKDCNLKKEYYKDKGFGVNVNPVKDALFQDTGSLILPVGNVVKNG